MSQNNQLIVSQTALANFNPEDIQTIRETIAKDCNESQFKLFMAIAQNANANPILNEIFPSVFGGKLTVQFGIDFYVRKAKEAEGFLGYDVQLVHENDEIKMHQERDEDGRYYIVIDDHSFGFPRGKVIAGYAIAYKEGFKPFSVIMEVDEVEHYKRSNIGMQKTMWTNNFNDMFKKHMVRRALKAASGLNFDDGQVENQDDSGIPEYQPQTRRDITPNQEVIDAPKQPKPEQSEEEKQVKKLRSDITKKLKQIGVEGKEATAEYIAQHAPKMGDKPTLAQLTGLLNIIEMHIDMNEAQASDDDSLE
jgi:recombination protein RecT